MQADIADRRALREVFAAWRFEAVFHFAALSLVGESMREPLRYCAENLSNSLRLAEAAVEAGCLRFVLSSTAALFGDPERTPIDEDARLAPTSAYGESKLMVERGLAWAEGRARAALGLPPLLQRRRRRPGRAASARTTSRKRTSSRWRSAPRSARVRR